MPATPMPSGWALRGASEARLGNSQVEIDKGRHSGLCFFELSGSGQCMSDHADTHSVKELIGVMSGSGYAETSHACVDDRT